ncbi:PQQ-binding-like beta-propeller repeat protein [Agromyces sp. SYSU K20354]|uniref:nSTAND1 domain-containing NTPase n=1 Tax=Agromyces cavernae TaxID=2898659 RepID=UPI001E40D148|nr:BTAD domain-containing putative transcriptional regulator [Agromyces cavernae]MCD2442549.1 PQQ-binding-like beta-propeller repeat protein [Agromyces cavernae]
MSVAVFGPLTLEGVTLSPRERIVLSVLVLGAGRPVTTDELADALWGDEPPGTWPKQLQASIGRVRSAIGRNAIETTPGAYTLRIDPDTVDAERFERFAASAREHLDDDPTRAVDAVDRARALWRGTPYADLASWPPAVVEAERLDEVRMELEEIRVEGNLRLGEHAATVGDAERLVREAPLRERRWVLLATALYRSGRQADALAAIRAARERLADELGAEPGAELSELELGILRHDDSLEPRIATTSTSTACPYRGLQPFGVDDEEDFFGRDVDIEAALARLATSRFLAVSGASGSGKSSLVRAGVVPALQRRGDRVVILTPEHALDARIREAVWSGRAADVVVVDQFEEVFHAGEADVDAAARAIAEAAVTGTTIILVVRSDFLDDCAGHPDLAPLVAESVHLVGPMAPAALREAIEAPARRAGLRLEPGLVELMLRDATGEAGALPHLSHALVETWIRREGATLTVAGYEASGGISGAIAQSADRLYQAMDPDQRVTCHWLLLRLVALGPDGSPVRRRVPSRPLRADASREQVLSMLARSRLVSAGADSVEVAHESLATAWPRLRAWLEEDADGARILTAVAAAAEAWNAAGRPEDDLLRGARLQAAIEWRDAAPRDLTDVELAFLDACEARATAEREQFEERARRDRRQNRRLRAMLGVAAGLVVLLAGAGSVAVVSSREASAQRDSATIEALVGTALALRSSERDVSALLAAEAFRRWPEDPRTRSGLMGVLQGAGGFLGNAVLAQSGNAYGSLIPGTEEMLVVMADGETAVRDAETGGVVQELDLGFRPGLDEPRPLVEVSGDGRVGAMLWPAETQPIGVTWYGTSPQSDLVAFDLVRGERILGPVRLQAGTGALTVNADGSIIAVADARDGTVTLVTSPGGAMREIADDHPVALDRDSMAAALAFDHGGRLVVGRLDDRVDMIDPASATISASFPVPDSSAHVAIAFGEASGIAVASGDRGLVAFEPDDGQVRWSTPIGRPYTRPCNGLAVSERMQRVYCGTPFGRIEVFDLADGAPLREEELGPLYGAVGPIDVDSDGMELTTISASHPIISRWRLDENGPGRRLVAPGRMVVGPYSYDGASILVAPQAVIPSDGWVVEGTTVMDVATGDDTYRFDEPAMNIGWASEDRLFAQSADDEVTRLVDTSRGEPVGKSRWGLWALWPSPEGTTLYAVRRDGWIQDVDPRTGQAVGDSWRVEGFPVWISVSPDGDRLAVTYWTDGTSEDVEDGSASDERGWALAIVSAAEHRVLFDEPVRLGAHVLLEDGGLIGLEDNRMGRYETEPISRVGTVPGVAGGLYQPSLSRDARTLLVSTADGNGLLYDAPTGERLGEPFPTDDKTLAGSMLRPDGLEVAISMPEGIVVWDIDPDHQFEYVCRLAGRDLTENEWRTYLGHFGEPQSTCGFSEE